MAGCKEAGKKQAGPFPAREHTGGSPGGLGKKEEIAQVGEDVLAVAVDHYEVPVGGGVFGHRKVVLDLLLELIEVGDLQLGSVIHGPGIRLQLFEQELQQGGLARSVQADHADLVPRQMVELKSVTMGFSPQE